jgi:hypothetical protein
LNNFLLYCRYIIATQDKELQAVARRIPGTPLLYLHQKAPTLEQPSAASSRMARINSNEKLVRAFNLIHVCSTELIILLQQQMDVEVHDLFGKLTVVYYV